MTEALAALRVLDEIAKTLARPPPLPAVSSCQKVADAVGDIDGVPQMPPGSILEVIRAELRAGCLNGGAASISQKILRQAPLVFWHGDPPAAAFPNLLRVFFDRATSRTPWMVNLIEAWLRDFDPARIDLPPTGRAIGRHLVHAEHPRLRPWAVANETFQLFDAIAGARNVAHALLNGPSDTASILTSTGMNDPRRADGLYFRAVVRALLAALPDAIRAQRAAEIWQRATGVLEVQRESRDRNGRSIIRPGLRFAEMAGVVARACLSPWLPGAPPAAPRKAIETFLLRTIGDPRLEPTRWTGAGEDATGLMRRWLSSASLDLFFNFISQTNDDPQWRYRQTFWRACFAKMPTAEVWVVLGANLASRAKTMRDLGSFGVNESRFRNAADQAVFLMRMGDLVLSEWSNVGPVRAWEADNRKTPHLYRKSPYRSDELRGSSLDFPSVGSKGGSTDGKGLWHREPQSGLWQACVTELLRQRLGLHLLKQDYMP